MLEQKELQILSCPKPSFLSIEVTFPHAQRSSLPVISITILILFYKHLYIQTKYNVFYMTFRVNQILVSYKHQKVCLLTSLVQNTLSQFLQLDLRCRGVWFIHHHIYLNQFHFTRGFQNVQLELKTVFHYYLVKHLF